MAFDYDEFVRTLRTMNELGLSYVVSYDGRTGDKAHGKLLPRSLQLHHICIPAGRSTQATLLGQARQTVESLYLSPTLVRRLENPEPCAKAVWLIPSTQHDTESRIQFPAQWPV